MFFWTPYTFVRIVLFFIAGILLGIYQPDWIPENFALSIFIGLVLVYFFVFAAKLKSVYPGIIGLSAVFLAGYLNTLHKTDARNPFHFQTHPSPITRYRVVITNHAEEKEKSWKTEASVLSVYDGDTWQARTGNILLYFSKQDFEKPFLYGDELLIKGSPQELKGPANPGEFDYKRFLTFRKIYHQHFLRKENVYYWSHQPPWLVMEYAIRARMWAERVLNQYITGEKERAVAFALILGVKDGLDNDLVHAYSSSGAMHVLAVSGLHVGIIYLIFTFFLRPMKSMRYGKWVLAILSVLILWSYAFITGLSPSVLRAVTMFSFLSIARPLNYGTNIFNTLAVSAFCLLLWEPFMVMSVGFQLSYLAVIGIVYLQPKLYQLWVPKSLIWDKIWQITCVSLAAQLATFALGILYFHQFPVYFLVSNLFVIPGALISLCLGIVLLAVSWISPVAQVVGMVLEGVVWLLNYLVFAVERLPFSLIDNIYISTLQSWLLLGGVISIVLVIQFRKFSYVILCGACGLLFGMLQWKHHYDQAAHSKLVVYQVNGHSALEWVDRGRSYFYTDSLLLQDRERLRFHVRPNRLINGVHKIHVNDSSFIKTLDGLRLYTWGRLTVVQLIDGDFFLPSGLEVDYLVLSNNAVRYLKDVSSVKFKTLIVDSSNSMYTATTISNEAQDMGISFHSVLHQGAFITKL